MCFEDEGTGWGWHLSRKKAAIWHSAHPPSQAMACLTQYLADQQPEFVPRHLPFPLVALKNTPLAFITISIQTVLPIFSCLLSALYPVIWYRIKQFLISVFLIKSVSMPFLPTSSLEYASSRLHSSFSASQTIKEKMPPPSWCPSLKLP